MATSKTQVADATQAGAVAYPDDFRDWAHVKSALVSARHPDFEDLGGFRHIYANAQALVGYRGRAFPDGSVIVVDWLEGREENGMFSNTPCAHQLGITRLRREDGRLAIVNSRRPLISVGRVTERL